MEETRDPWLRRDMIRVVIETGLLDIYSLRGPTEGKIVERWSEHPGDDDLSLPRQYAYWLQTDEQDDLVFALSSRLAFPGFRCAARVGERVGQRIGYLFFGAELDVYLPVCSRIEAASGDRVLAGTRIIGSFVHDENAAGDDLQAVSVS